MVESFQGCSGLAFRVFFESVTDTSQGFNVAAVISKLAAQPDDLDIHTAVGDRIIVAAHGVDDLRPCKSPPGLPGSIKSRITRSIGLFS